MSVTFFRRKLGDIDPKKGYWDNQDIADFYRAVELLKQAGLNTEVDSGVTDEGDPWFVFMKPDTGDVIAHFAQIDGRFIAVSSLNQEVYKGGDIRSIVDQMLERHPLLLPQNRNSGRLMLHPTAALSAFLAAAFILTIDGVKASNLTDVLVGVVSEERDVEINNDAPWIPYGQRSETMKGMFSDLNLANYNVAVLGAALIAHKLSHNELDLNPQPREDDGSILLNSSVEEKVEVENISFNIHLGSQRGSGENDHMAYAVKSENLNINDKEGDYSHSEEKPDNIENSQGAVNKAGLNQASGEDVAVFSEGYEVLWTNGAKILKNNYQLINQVTKNNVNEQFDATTVSDSVLVDEPSGSNLAVVLKNIQETFQLGPTNFGLDTVLLPDVVGMTFNSAGELKLVSLGAIEQKSSESGHSTVDLSPDQGLNPIIHPAESRDKLDLSYASSENVDIGSSQVEQTVHNKPIIGHPLNELNDTLELTDAIDVVFYQGGDAEIAEFELGIDLLWFFLPEEELKAVNNTVNQEGDLVLDFGETGTLTFLGMVSDTFADGTV
jgi:hypothetical protein